MEIITGVERRRRWRPEEKLRILAEIDGGAKLNEVARRHDVSRGLIWQWREARRRGRLVEETAVFVPVRVIAELPAPEPTEAATVPSSPPCGERAPEADRPVEIVLPDGTILRVAEGVSLPALRRLVAAVRG
jgi:transposase